MFAYEFPTREEALARERQIKGWSRKKKEAMMRGDWTEVSRLARRKRPSILRQAQDERFGPIVVSLSNHRLRTSGTWSFITRTEPRDGTEFEG